MFYTYILRSQKDDNLYIGSTTDLKKRLVEHNAGGVQSTKSRLPMRLVYYEAYTAEKDARNREAQLKKRGQARAQLISRLKYSLQQPDD